MNLVKEYQNNSTATSNEFVYDANGNMTKDLDRDIYTIKYNVLNLPEIVQFKNGNQIKNTYNAGGQKLGTEYFTWLPGANAPVINIGDVLNIGYSQGAIDQSGTAYIGSVEYNTKNGNSSLTAICRIHNMEGYVENISSPNYYYYRKDHLGNNREVWLANTNTTKQWTQYYPSGLPWVTTSNDNLSTQPYKYSDKEFVEMHGLDEYDSQARWFYPAIVRTPTLDPHCENYFDISPYAWCGNNPVNKIDPDGRDYWSTSDPATIERFMNSMQQVGGSQLPSESFDYGNWGHATDAQFTSGLTYNDENQTFYSSYGTVENGQSVIHGIKIKAASFGDGNASVQTAKGKWYDKSSGAIEQVNVEFDIITFWRGLVNSGLNLFGNATEEITAKSLGAAAKGFSKNIVPTGFKETKEFGYQHGQKVYEYMGKYFSKDFDGHNGGIWKVFELVGGKLKRIGTADEALTIFKK